jgi:hypothetical protein
MAGRQDPQRQALGRRFFAGAIASDCWVAISWRRRSLAAQRRASISCLRSSRSVVIGVEQAPVDRPTDHCSDQRSDPEQPELLDCGGASENGGPG